MAITIGLLLQAEAMLGTSTDSDLGGCPTWLAIGPDVHDDREVDRSLEQTLEMRMEPRWFLGLPMVVKKDEFLTQLSAQKAAGYQIVPDPATLVGATNAVVRVYSAPPYPSALQDLPLVQRGAHLELQIAETETPESLRFMLRLHAGSCPLRREHERRYTNVLPFLFAFYVDGQAVTCNRGTVSRPSGGKKFVQEVEASGVKTWNVRVSTASVRRILPDKPVSVVAVVAAFAEREHTPLGIGESGPVVQQFFLTEEDCKRPQILIRSNGVRLTNTSGSFIPIKEAAESGPPTAQSDRGAAGARLDNRHIGSVTND